MDSTCPCFCVNRSRYCARKHQSIIMNLVIFSTLTMLVTFSSAQFQFFEQMFQGQGQQEPQQQQNVASDSNWYQQTYNEGICHRSPCKSAKLAVWKIYVMRLSKLIFIHDEQHTAQITFARAHSPAYISHIIAPAHGQRRKIKWSWARAA